ncbi:protein-L-isoaspartate O-methyltransferase [Candidatus Persebacteraceae bacterium Df01]|jgi:protein-L-isoaspartate(D-aspartate) O-methyltransferase|uniref:Protein-L-isoaspartate O-methyltransferase n=1 Tax=Candidatus Doriopsillibacter californiensis TaxID=2970740 RepID=A0ABT7QL91_9GAMM|nr:protein-L-isoaspartate O-methyltransferase [Candidatus Persebacteraceae bacterium Df01]
MIEQQIRTWDVLDNAVLSLYDDIRRADFVAAAALKDLAYADVELPIGHGQFMLEPKLEARMLQTLALHKHEEVLHIGTGSGFFAALLGRLTAKVVSMEIIPELSAAATTRLQSHGVNNVTIRTADGACGTLSGELYDAIVLTASTPVISPNFLRQLKNGGRLLAVEGTAPVMTLTLLEKRTSDIVLRKSILETCLPPLQNAPLLPTFTF